MTEELVSFETATLAKEKGFVHMKANCYGDNMAYQLPEGELINSLQGNIVAGYILAPTQSLLQKWLRDDCNIHCDAQYNTASGKGYIYIVGIMKKSCDRIDGFDTYEEALKKGLEEALKLI